MIKIGLDSNYKFKNILEEILDYEIVDAEKEEDFQILVIDIEVQDLIEKIKKYFQKNIPIVVVLGKNDIREMRTFFHSKYITDCILRQDVYEIEKSIEKILKNSKKFKKFYLNDTFKRGIIDFEEVNYINYCRITRKTQFILVNKDTFSMKTNFSVIEKTLEGIKNFYKIERGTIINIDSIKILDFKEEMIVFKDSSILYISKNKLKELEDNSDLHLNKIYF